MQRLSHILTVSPHSELNVERIMERLTAREIEVLRLLVLGDSTKGVADRLGISFKTAATHRASIMNKLGVHKSASLVREALRTGLVAL